MSKIVKTKLISKYNNDQLVSYFKINKTWELIAQKYYWPTFCRNIKVYVIGCDIYPTSKSVKHKSYADLQSFPAWMYWWKDLSIDFIIGLPISTN